MTTIFAQFLVPAQQTRVELFEEIFLIFLVLGTLVGIVVIAYTLYNAYKYRDSADVETDVDRPTVGEMPTGGKGGRKLFVSFLISAIIVISLIVWSYGVLLDVEEGPPNADVEIDVQAQAFNFGYEYHDEHETSMFDNLVVPAGDSVVVNVTSTDVWHTFGISQERVKADAKPGEYSQTWFVADEPGVYGNAVECFELCGDQHSNMQHDLTVVEADLFYAAQSADAIDELPSAIEAGDLDVDSSPEELEDYLDEQTDDTDENDTDDGDDGEDTEGGDD